MLLSKETLAIIKNFSSINNTLIIKPGNVLSTVSEGRSVLAEAVVSENFPIDFAIYDITSFLAVTSLFDLPELEFSQKYVDVKEGINSSIRYFAADVTNLKPVPSVKSFPDAAIKFNLSSVILKQILSAAAVIGTDDFTVVGDGTNVTISIADKSNPTSSSYNTIVGETDKVFRVFYKISNIKLIPDSYVVEITNKKISRFRATSQNLVYYVAYEADSTFDFE